MQIIIDIPEELAEKGHRYTDEEMQTVIKAAQNGTPISGNATNGDMIKAMFPNCYCKNGQDINDLKKDDFATIVLAERGGYISCQVDWWNAPHKTKCEDCMEWEYFGGYGYGCFCMKTMVPIDADKCEFYADKH